jgi:hypothetical protein
MAKKRRRSNHPQRADQRAGTRTTERAEPTGTSTHQKRSPARTRAEKKELARQRRERERKRQTRARFIRMYVTLVVISGVLVLAVFLIRRGDEPARPTTLPGELTTEAPWPANTEQLGQRLDILGLPPAGETEHVHANLQIFVEGQPVAVPVDIGLDGDTHASLHTHDEGDVIHVESQTARDFTLGEFFDVWGVRLNSTCLGGYCATGGERLQVFVDGEEVTGNKRDVVLDDETVIVVAFGTEDQLPDPIPATFDFASVAG